MSQFELRPFAIAESETVAGWAISDEDREFLTGSSDLLTEQTIALWRIEAAWAFTLRLQGDMVAYGEIIEDEVEGDMEIQRLLVAPDRRGRGIGKALLSRLCAFAASARPYPEVWLRAPRASLAVQHCAKAVGFQDSPNMSGPRYLWLRKKLSTTQVTHNDSF